MMVEEEEEVEEEVDEEVDDEVEAAGIRRGEVCKWSE